MEGMTTEQITAHQKVDRLIASELPDKRLRRQAWEEVKRLSQTGSTKHMQIEDGVAEACRIVKLAAQKAAEAVGGEHNAASDDATDQPHVERDPRQLRPAVRVRHESNDDSSPAEESPEELTEIISKMAEARGGRPLVHRWDRR